MRYSYDVIVIGAGHAGCEAACAAARMGSTTLLITLDMNKIAQMSCNPAVGGIAKGQIVREIDALGGNMGVVTDRATIQFRMLNKSKGPAMWSPRAQCDRHRFMEQWRMALDGTPNLFVWQDSVTSLVVENNTVSGVRTALGVTFRAPAVVLTAGTFLNGMMHVGRVQTAGGRVGEPAATGITEQLTQLGHDSARMKTGTPVRIDERTVDFTQAERQDGDGNESHFSFLPHERTKLKQRPCWIVFTNSEVHDTLREALPHSPLYNGQINSIGPRYCPSIETKLVTFPDKEAHQLFLEPEGEHTCEMYLNGFSSSMPWEAQFEALRKIPALRDAHFYRPGYAIEYDFFDPRQLTHTLESKIVRGLFLAGQVNGTTGYEEAAGQGLVAGVNAHLSHCSGDTFTLARDEAYIGVLIDDLVTKGVDEPYRMFTSRAEHRILLRQDDADQRLTPRAAAMGLASSERETLLRNKREQIDRIIGFAHERTVKAAEVSTALEAMGMLPLKQGVKLYDLVLRPQLSLHTLATLLPDLATMLDTLEEARREEIVSTAEVEMKYSGYIERERLMAQRVAKLERVTLKGKLHYPTLMQLSTEARQKLQRIDPETIGQASRIPGISPSDINILLLLLNR